MKQKNQHIARLNDALVRVSKATNKIEAARVQSSLKDAIKTQDVQTDAHINEMENLRAELKTKHAAHAQLTKRVQAFKDRQEKVVATLEQRVAHLMRNIEDAGMHIKHQDDIIANLTKTCAMLREAGIQHCVAGADINHSMHIELTAYKNMYEAQKAEVSSVLKEIDRLISGDVDG